MQAEGLEQYEFTTTDLSISIRKGERQELDAHIAIVLASHGIVSIEIMTSAAVRKKVMEERASTTLTPLPQDYYEHLTYSLEHTQDAKERDRMLMAGKELTTMRLEKLTKLAQQGKQPKTTPALKEKSYYLQQEHLFTETLKGILQQKTEEGEPKHGS